MQKIPRFVIWLLWITWTIMLCFLMLSPSDGTVKDISSLFGGTEITDAIGHVILISIDCALLYFVLNPYFSQANTSKIAVGFTLILGISLELAQVWIPSRGASLIDILAACIGVGLTYFFISRFSTSATMQKLFGQYES